MKKKIILLTRMHKIQLHFSPMYYLLEHIGSKSWTSKYLTFLCAISAKAKTLLLSR